VQTVWFALVIFATLFTSVTLFGLLLPLLVIPALRKPLPGSPEMSNHPTEQMIGMITMVITMAFSTIGRLYLLSVGIVALVSIAFFVWNYQAT
jgi:hypothetical protein